MEKPLSVTVTFPEEGLLHCALRHGHRTQESVGGTHRWVGATGSGCGGIGHCKASTSRTRSSSPGQRVLSAGRPVGQQPGRQMEQGAISTSVQSRQPSVRGVGCTALTRHDSSSNSRWGLWSWVRGMPLGSHPPHLAGVARLGPWGVYTPPQAAENTNRESEKV